MRRMNNLARYASISKNRQGYWATNRFLFWSRLLFSWRPIVLASISLGMVLTGMWLWITGGLFSLQTSVCMEFIHLSVWMGFILDDIHITGHVHTPVSHILAAIQVKRGDSILALDIYKAKQRLEDLPWVQSAVVERRLPDVLRLTLVEKQAAALWQQSGHYILIDANGIEILDDVALFRHLPVIVGDQAPSQVKALVILMQSQPILASRVRAAQFVSGRRWNLRLDDVKNGIDIRLPEENALGALQFLVALDREYKLLHNHTTMIDLRIPGRLILRIEYDERK